MFNFCGALDNVVIPERVVEIGDYAFAGCMGLADIVIPDGVEIIGSNTFQECISLERIEVPDSVEQIGDYSFYGFAQHCIRCENFRQKRLRWALAFSLTVHRLNV